MKRKMLYNIGSTCRNRSDQRPVKNPLTFSSQKPEMIPNSLEQYHKKCMKNSVENMDVDTGALTL